MSNRCAGALIAVLGAGLGLMAAPAAADPRWDGAAHGSHDRSRWARGSHSGDDGHGDVDHGPWRHQWGDGDIRHFHDHDWDHWHHGYWSHGWYGGYFGWWFVVSGVGFWYPAPAYPYPDPYVPPTFIVPPPPAGAAPVTTPYWYYCPPSNGYYPYVASCPSGWQQVPATPDVDGPPNHDMPPSNEAEDEGAGS